MLENTVWVPFKSHCLIFPVINHGAKVFGRNVEAGRRQSADI